MPVETIRLDDREFTLISGNVTAAQNDYILVYLNESGASDVLAPIAGTKKKPDERLGTVLLQTILKSGLQANVLAGLLTEKGKKWTRAEADRNAAIFADITDRKEQALMRTAMVGFVLGFFQSGEASSKTSPKSSNPSEQDPDTSSVEAPISENSRTSSAT